MQLHSPEQLPAETFLEDAHASDSITVEQFGGRFGAPAAVTYGSDSLAWRYECADVAVTLELDPREHAQDWVRRLFSGENNKRSK